MKTKIYYWWQEMRSSFWFVPAMIVLDAVVLAAVLIGVDATVDLHIVERWPLIFGAGAAGARGLLTTVASSMITVAGVVFSITIVALALTSSQYTSRVLRNFMRDPINQVVLGVFVGIFAYCLVVLRTIRGGDEGAFVPSLAVLVGLILAFVGIAFLIYFIHHISMSIQASSILAAAAQDTINAVDHLFPNMLSKNADEEADGHRAIFLAEHTWTAIPAQKTGYIENVGLDALLALARERGIILRMERGIGEFVVEDTPLISVAGSGELDEQMTDELNALYVISRQRLVEQDVAFGIRQIVDIALKALSPGINDTTTAVMCVDYLTAILVRLSVRRIVTSLRLDKGELRVIARGPSFESLLAEAFDQIRQNAEANVAVLTRLLQALETIAGQTTNTRRRRALSQQADLIASAARRTISTPHDMTDIDISLTRLSHILGGHFQEHVSRMNGTESID
ncbi:MAG: DUF2254 domain-containing protein [Methylobacter sp.]|uniref:DUF2254 domain-containing protein n=1 Tax=Candidatus Methylobacter titanis TaxID=3053457 RepID=A0AA43THG2_9GAMM|nr:DUF2254 domain-containing protein [Candidatus Methylobacter titanis]